MVSSALYYKLREVARSGGSTTAKAIAPIAGIDPATAHFEAEIGPVLETINREEDAEGRPLLAAVVVLSTTGMPSAEFFASARELGVHAGDDDRSFWERELRRVHDYWYRN